MRGVVNYNENDTQVEAAFLYFCNEMLKRILAGSERNFGLGSSCLGGGLQCMSRGHLHLAINQEWEH